MADPMFLSAIHTPDWQPKVGELGAIVEDLADIDQCIRTILSTPKGSLAHQPDFGSDLWRYLDWPIDEARPHIVREIVDAVALWEPRVEITAVAFGLSDELGTAVIQIARRRRGASSAAGTIAFEVAA